MTDKAIIEAVARALFAHDQDPILWCDHTGQTRDNYRDAAKVALAAATPLIRAAALEEAAKVAEEDKAHSWQWEEVTAAIRALRDKS